MFLKNLIKNGIKFYHNYLSQLTLCQCRYYPTCSEYTLQAIERRGVFIGLIIGFLRVLRCNPFFRGGYDPYEK